MFAYFALGKELQIFLTPGEILATAEGKDVIGTYFFLSAPSIEGILGLQMLDYFSISSKTSVDCFKNIGELTYDIVLDRLSFRELKIDGWVRSQTNPRITIKDLSRFPVPESVFGHDIYFDIKSMSEPSKL